MGKMFYLGLTINENIIKKNKDKMTDKMMENMVHETLEKWREGYIGQRA
jgi:hypothetical protein